MDVAKQNAKLSERLALVCKENSNLTAELVVLQKKNDDLIKAPFQQDSPLGQLFNPNNRSKNTAKEQLQKLCDALQKDYVEYKLNHTHSDEEYDALLKRFESAQHTSSDLANLLKNQPNFSSTEEESSLEAENERLKKELFRVQQELVARASNVSVQPPRYGAKDKSYGEEQLNQLKILQEEIESIKSALTTEKKLHKSKCTESDALSSELERLRREHRAEQKKVKESRDTGGVEEKAFYCGQCDSLRLEREEWQRKFEEAQEAIHQHRSQMMENVSAAEKKYALLESKYIETQHALEEKKLELRNSVPKSVLDKISIEKTYAEHEGKLLKDRIKHMETIRRGSADGGEVEDEAEILSALEQYKERITTLEFEKGELIKQTEALEAVLKTEEEKQQQLHQKSLEDGQRVAFLLKKSAGLAADLRKLQIEEKNALEMLEVVNTELQHTRKRVEAIPALQKKIETLTEENTVIQTQLTDFHQTNCRLEQAQERIAYLEAKLSSTVGLEEFAEVQAEKKKLEGQLSPLQRDLEEVQKQLELVTSDKELLVRELDSKKNLEEEAATVGDLKDQLQGAQEAQKLMLEKLARMKEENNRLTSLNTSLDAQVVHMQSGIAEMAVHLEKERTAAKEAADKSAEKEIVRLREELERAKSTIAGVQATEGQYIAEGLYLSAVEEKQELLDEVQRKTIELEKKKSEIYIYRQTIAELEAENDEHVQDIEQLQKTVEEQRATLEQNNISLEKNIADSQVELVELRDAVKTQQIELEALKAQLADIKLDYERKCESEAELLSRIARFERDGGDNGKNAVVSPGGLHTPASSTAGVSESPPLPGKKKVKRLKKKKTLAEQLGEEGDDVTLGDESVVKPMQLNWEAAEGQPQIVSSETINLQAENSRLKKTIEKLSKEISEYRSKVMSGPLNNEEEIIRLTNEVQDLHSMIEAIQNQRDQAKLECKRIQTLISSGDSGTGAKREIELKAELDNLRAELDIVASQLLPTKEKLSEYMAMADRIGMKYPFSAEHEKKLARKLRKVKKDVALS